MLFRSLMEFVKAGAPEEILYVSKPHIGTFKLVKMVENMRAEIIRLGGEVRFGEKVDRLLFEPSDSARDKHVSGLVLANGETLYSRHVVLAIGHSARDTFQMLRDAEVYIEPKPFSIGFRIEHPQSTIDRARFGKQAGHPILGAAEYKLCITAATAAAFTVFACAREALWSPRHLKKVAW